MNRHFRMVMKRITYTNLFIFQVDTICLGPNSPVSFVGWSDIWWMLPLAHLQDSDEKQRVYPPNARGNSNTHDFSCTLGGIAEVIRIWKCMNTTVQSDRTCDCKIRKYPISSCKWTIVPQEIIDKTPNANFFPRHVEVIKSEIIIGLQPWNVKPVVDYYS